MNINDILSRASLTDAEREAADRAIIDLWEREPEGIERAGREIARCVAWIRHEATLRGQPMTVTWPSGRVESARLLDLDEARAYFPGVLGGFVGLLYAIVYDSGRVDLQVGIG